MTVDEIRALLDRTGPLYTRDPEDVGHISERWRKAILSLCDLLDAAPLDVAEQLRAERRAHRDTKASVTAQEALRAAAEGKATEHLFASQKATEALTVARQLVGEAIPRMRTLNNQMSPGWLARADELLGGD